MKDYSKPNVYTGSTPNASKPKLSKAAQKIIERKKKNDVIINEMKHKIKGQSSVEDSNTRNYDQTNVSNNKAKSENYISNVLRIKTK